MDKYEFNIKVEQIKKLVNKGDYETAMKIADTIDWRRVRSTSLLTMVAQVYERNAEYQDAKDILLLAFERAPLGKGLLFKLTDLALREGNVPEAEAYYREFCDLAGDDPRQNLLRFLILEAKGATLEQLIHSLEKYIQQEMDEKWMYHLAELYQQAGMESQCVGMCDKIMLLFGLGKYVDKAMELKLQFAPLTKYQMDLVENREKYEEKLRAVEEKYNNKTFRREPDEEEYFDSEDEEEPVMEEQETERLRMYDREAVHERRMRDRQTYDQDENVYDEYNHDADTLGMEAGEDMMYPDERSFLEDEIVPNLHEARAEEELAREMSMMEPYDEEEGSSMGETRILDNIRDIKEYRLHGGMEEEDRRLAAAQTAASHESTPLINRYEEEEETIVEDWDLEPDEELSNHLMIEAENPENGLALALDSLKKIHRELGTKNPVAKISGDNLNKKGIFAVSERLAGKDLVVEKAADLDRITIGELSELMEQDNTGMIVVLIDTPSRMERLHNSYPSLAGKFQYIGCGESGNTRPDPAMHKRTEAEKAHEEELLRRQAERDAEAARRRLAEREEEIRRQAARDAEAARRIQGERVEEPRSQVRREEEMGYASDFAADEEGYGNNYAGDNEYPADYTDGGSGYQEYADENAGYPTEYNQEVTGRRAGYEAEESMRQAEYEAANAVQRHAEREADEARRLAEYEEEQRPRRQGEEEQRHYQYEEDAEAGEEPEEPDDNEDYQRGSDDGSEMDVEEFAQYACKYATEIDCSISGKSMLALYERAEMMEEDGVPLTKANAEELIEEAADKAEKRSFGGMFSSKYDKDGMLILKEKHFFD